jgi:hypothetical protein
MSVNRQSHLTSHILQLAPQPPVVYHYTNQAGLLGILQTGTLWATDVRFLNDSREFEHTLGLARLLLVIKRSEVSSAEEQKLIDEWIGGLEIAKSVRVFATSFSAHPDLLSQWRGYGSDAGYAIGFGPESLRAAAGEHPLPTTWLRCIYDWDLQQELINSALDYLLDHFRQDLTMCQGQHDFLLASYGADFLAHLLLLAACFKDSGFQEEMEWRLVARESTPDQRYEVDLQFRTGPRNLVPYICLPWRRSAAEPVISEIVVGPTPHMKIACEAVTMLLRSLSVPCESVRESRIPFRNW